MSAREDALARDLAARTRLADDPIAKILMRRRDARDSQNPHGERTDLHPRELEALRYASHGVWPYAMIADAMAISSHTVRSHLKHARAKLGAKTNTHAVAIAIRRGLIP